MKRNDIFLLCLLSAFLVLFGSCKNEKLPKVSTTEVSDITLTSASSGGVVNDEGTEVSMRGVCYSMTNDHPTVNDDKITIDGDGVGVFTSKIENLEPNTLYYVRAYAMNSAGAAYGETFSFRTLKDTLSELVQLLCIPNGWVLSEATSVPAYHLSNGTYVSNLLDGYIPEYDRDDIIRFENRNNYIIQVLHPGAWIDNYNGYQQETALGGFEIEDLSDGWVDIQIPFFHDYKKEYCKIIALSDDMFKISYTWNDESEAKEYYTFYLTYVPANK
jgi:hypothetical protein